MIGWPEVATSLLYAEGARWSSRDAAEAGKAFRPSTARRYPPVGLTRPSSDGLQAHTYSPGAALRKQEFSAAHFS